MKRKALLTVTYIKIIFIAWDWTNSPQNIVFNIYHTTNATVVMPKTITNTVAKPVILNVPMEKWPLILTTTNHQIMVICDQPVGLYAVKASNTVTHVESTWATTPKR